MDTVLAPYSAGWQMFWRIWMKSSKGSDCGLEVLRTAASPQIGYRYRSRESACLFQSWVWVEKKRSLQPQQPQCVKVRQAVLGQFGLADWQLTGCKMDGVGGQEKGELRNDNGREQDSPERKHSYLQQAFNTDFSIEILWGNKGFSL